MSENHATNLNAPGHYVRRVQEDTKRYLAHLRLENETLRTLVASLDAENAQLSEPLAQAEQLIAESDELAAQATERERELERLEELMLRMRGDMKRAAIERAELRQQLNEVTGKKREFAEEYALLERRNNNLANLYVASYSLHGTLDRDAVVQAIQEIIINLVGSEKFAIYDASDEQLPVLASFGLEADTLSGTNIREGRIGATARSGERYVADTNGAANGSGSLGEPLACIPLRIEDRTIGVVAIAGLLEHKSGLTRLDLELFDLLETQAATALYSSGLVREQRADG